MVFYNSATGAIVEIPAPLGGEVARHLQAGDRTPALDDSVLKHLQRAGLLVPAGRDELAAADLLRERTRGAAGRLQLALLPTEECNFRCTYCYENFALGRMPGAVVTGLKRYATARAPELRALEVYWFGGEPLCALDVIEDLSNHFIGLSREYGFRYRAGITSNCYELTRVALGRLLAAQVDRIQVTLDGPREAHDGRRRRCDGGATFDTIVSRLREVSALEARVRVTIGVNFDADNHYRIPELIDLLAAQFGPDDRFFIYFRPVGAWGGPSDTAPVLDEATATQRAMAFYDLAIRAGLRTDWVQSNLRPGGYVCSAAMPYQYVIRADGRVQKCTVALAEDEINTVGRLLPDGQMALDASALARWVNQDENIDTACQRCFFRMPCQGASCPLVRIRAGRPPCPPEKARIMEVISMLAAATRERRTSRVDASLECPM